MTILYNVNSTFKGVNGFGSPFGTDSYSCTVSANTDTTLTVPASSALGMASSTITNTFLAIFHYPSSASVYVANNSTAEKPVGNTFAATTSVLNPSAKIVKAGDVLHFFCVAGADVSVEFFSTQEN